MRKLDPTLHLVLVASLLLSTACASSGHQHLTTGQGTPRIAAGSPQPTSAQEAVASRTEAPSREGLPAPEPMAGVASEDSAPVLMSELPGGTLRLSLPALTPLSSMERLGLGEIRPLLAAFESLQPRARPRLRLLEAPEVGGTSRGRAAPWESRLRKDFLALYGPTQLPLPETLESSRLLFALKRSTRYMNDGIREAAEELFSAPAFLASVALSIGVYFSAWLVPEPLFSKAFAAGLTVRLALLVGLVELGRLAHTALRLYQDVEAATTAQELEEASARFGKAMGGVFLRVLVVMASFGVPQVLPQVPKGGLWTLLSPLRHSPVGGPALESVTAVQVVADGTLVIHGVAAGTSAASVCGEFAVCAMMGGAGGRPKLSTRYGKPHTRQNPPHNEAIEEELARREAAGHSDLRKNKPQKDATDVKVRDPAPQRGVRFRKPDASSLRPDGVRHNTNYVSNPRDLKRELEAFDSLMRADPYAIHELYLLNGTLLRRYVPQGVSFP